MSMIERAGLIIDIIEYLTIATVCSDGTPWNSPVYAAFDDNLNFYWKSWVENQHSKNILTCPDVFLVIYDSRARCMEGEGVYMKARARPLMPEDEEEIKHGYELLKRRAGNASSEYTDFLDGNPRRIYKAVPSRAWMNDGSSKNGDFIDVRKEIDLNHLKQGVRYSSTN